MKHNSKFIFSLSTLIVLLLSIKPAHAYLDPGTGSMLIQAVLAVIAAVSVSIGIFWNRLRSLFGRKDSGEHDSDDD